MRSQVAAGPLERLKSHTFATHSPPVTAAQVSAGSASGDAVITPRLTPSSSPPVSAEERARRIRSIHEQTLAGLTAEYTGAGKAVRPPELPHIHSADAVPGIAAFSAGSESPPPAAAAPLSLHAGQDWAWGGHLRSQQRSASRGTAPTAPLGHGGVRGARAGLRLWGTVPGASVVPRPPAAGAPRAHPVGGQPPAVDGSRLVQHVPRFQVQRHGAVSVGHHHCSRVSRLSAQVRPAAGAAPPALRCICSLDWGGH